MINSFSTSYSGHVLEEDRIGFNGIPANDRWYPNDRLIEAFQASKEYAQLMEDLGYDVLWMAEHHFQREGYECIPNLLMLSLWLAQYTKRVKFGCGFNILPMWHPLRLAEDFAMADILTDGRVIFGIGRGYHTREVESFGAPMLDADANRDLFEEQYEVILKAFNEDSFSHNSAHYTLPPEVPYRGYQLKELTVVPRPIHRPVETWQPVVSGSARGIDFMAKHGIKGIVSGVAMEGLDNLMQQYQEANARYGRDLMLGENLAVAVICYLDDSRGKAVRTMRPIFEEQAKFVGPLGMLRGRTGQHVKPSDQGHTEEVPDRVKFEELLESRSWWCGTPEEIISNLKELEERYPGLEQFCITCPLSTTRARYREQVTRFAKEVMPKFKRE